MADLPPSHPLLERLYEWRRLADQERFAELFDAMLHQSGLVNRELFLSSSGRELTNYSHIFEILLEKAGARKLALGEVIELLSDYIVHRALPGGDDSDVLRIESERDAVQIMTVHKSKGLEAEVVFLFGGTHKGSTSGDAVVFHDGRERRVAIGKDARDAAKPSLACEEREEDERLMYVALTRARSKMYLPYFPEKVLRKKVSGFYKHLNDRLKILTENGKRSSELFEIVEVVAPDGDGFADATSLEAVLLDWDPPELLLDDTHDDDARKAISKIGTRHAPLKTWSYTSVQHARDAAYPFDAEGFRTAMDSQEARTGGADLPGGRAVGVFLHEVIEKLDFDSFGDARDLKSWSAREDVRELFANTMRRCGVIDARWMARGPEVVFNALTSRIALGETVLENGLYRLEEVREMEFTYPIPEKNHRLLANGRDGGEWVVERGYVKGFIDLVFRREDSIYFADWKGDLLPSYDPAAVTAHVERHYSLQASIYALGVVRLLGINTECDYEHRFGGLLYVFLRGVIPTGDGKSGLYFARPSWREIVSYESALMTTHVDG